MKKLIVAIITLLYVVSTSGATVHFHYCMGKLVETRLTHNDKGRCGKCGMLKKKSLNSCCKDEHKFVKVEQSHEKSAFGFQALVIPEIFPEYTISYPAFNLQQQKLNALSAHGPPPLLSEIPLFVRYRNFRI